MSERIYVEKIPVVPVVTSDGCVEMVGIDGNGNPDPHDFAGYDPSVEDVVRLWEVQNGHNPDTAEDYVSVAELFLKTQAHNDLTAGFGRSAIHSSWKEAGVHLPCDYSDPPTYERGDGLKALTRFATYRLWGTLVLSRPLADLAELADIDPGMTGKDIYSMSSGRRYFNEEQGGSDE